MLLNTGSLEKLVVRHLSSTLNQRTMSEIWRTFDQPKTRILMSEERNITVNFLGLGALLEENKSTVLHAMLSISWLDRAYFSSSFNGLIGWLSNVGLRRVLMLQDLAPYTSMGAHLRPVQLGNPTIVYYWLGIGCWEREQISPKLLHCEQAPRCLWTSL